MLLTRNWQAPAGEQIPGLIISRACLIQLQAHAKKARKSSVNVYSDTAATVNRGSKQKSSIRNNEYINGAPDCAIRGCSAIRGVVDDRKGAACSTGRIEGGSRQHCAAI